MQPRTMSYLRSRFREYYLEASLELPPDSASREWGFVLFDGRGMRRHKAFTSRNELVDYIRGMVPQHVYHSAAYYEHPGAPTMKEKIWTGTDLIFDLDADHLKGAPSSYRDMLALVKRETAKLLAFLMDDFGFSSEAIDLVFSGGRGYHIHVRDERVRPLLSDSRREIVDYLAGRGLDIERMISEVALVGDSGVEEAPQLRCPPAGAPGWAGRVNKAILGFVEHIRSLDEKEAVDLLSSMKGIGKKKATYFYISLKGSEVTQRIGEGNLGFFKGSSELWRILIKRYLEGEEVSFGLDEQRGETDEPVTADIKRLIRYPMSLHGGTGLRVTPIGVSGLDCFDPLRDAVVFGKEEVDIVLSRSFRLEIAEIDEVLDPGPARLPAYAAIMLIARGAAELGKG